MDKLYDRIDWVNDTTPALNEDNLNAMSKGIDDIDNRVLSLGSAVLEVIPDLEEMLSHAEELKEYRDDAVAAATSAEGDEEDAEAYAVGTRGGVPVTSGDPAYHNNAKYYSEQTNTDALANMTDVEITNPTAGEVLKYNSTSHKWENGTGGGGGGTSAQDVSYDNTTSGLTATNVQDAIDEVVSDTNTALAGKASLEQGGQWSAEQTVSSGTTVTFTDKTYSDDWAYSCWTDDGTGVAKPEPTIVVNSSNQVVCTFSSAFTTSTKVRLHYFTLS